MNQLPNVATLAGRAFIAAIFLISGFGKIGSYEATQGYMSAMGVPGGLLPAVIAFEIAAGLAVLVGWQTRIAAFLLAGFSLVTAVLFHGDLSDQMQSILFWKNVAIAGGFLFLVAHGAGAWSLDARLAGPQRASTGALT
ncbi:MAG: DoxX family protein [Gammaproteobacteria bacterium]|nr:DoxX family protein [Gammaproteobacteria bacterium]